MKLRLILSFIFLLTIQLSAQTFKARVSPNIVQENGSFQVEFTLKNGKGGSFTPPSFKAFKELSGVNTSQSTTIVNGKYNQEMSYSYSLLALKAGVYTINPATIVVAGKKIKSNPVQIKVVKGKAPNAKGQTGRYFVKLEVSDSTSYVGQQLILDYVLYTTVNIGSFELLTMDEFEGFYRQDVNIRTNSEQVEKDGEIMTRKVMKRLSIYPQQTGTYDIDPSTIRIGIKKPGTVRRSIFRSANLDLKNVVSNGLKIEVAGLPRPIPEDFSFAVGKYSIRSSIDKRSVTTDDAIKIMVELTGNGDPKALLAPAFSDSENFESYDPNETFSDQSITNGQIIHQNRFEYLVVPKKPGRQSLSQTVSYFDTEKDEFVQLKSGPFTINVSKGVGTNNDLNIKKDALDELSPIVENADLSKENSRFYKGPFYWLCILVSFLSMLAIIAYKIYLDKSGKLDPDIIRRKEAERLANQKLSHAESLVKNGGSPFYEATTTALKEYLSDRLDIPAKHLTKDSIRINLKEKGIQDSTINDILNLIEQCEVGMYAGINKSNPSETLALSKKLISVIEEEILRSA